MSMSFVISLTVGIMLGIGFGVGSGMLVGLASLAVSIPIGIWIASYYTERVNNAMIGGYCGEHYDKYGRYISGQKVINNAKKNCEKCHGSGKMKEGRISITTCDCVLENHRKKLYGQ